MECLYFHTTREFNNDQLIDAFRTVAFIEKVVWVESMIDHPNTGPLDNTTLYAEGKMGTGQFGFSYVAYLFHQPAPLTKTKLVGVMQRLAKPVSSIEINT